MRGGGRRDAPLKRQEMFYKPVITLRVLIDGARQPGSSLSRVRIPCYHHDWVGADSEALRPAQGACTFC